jgi:hypothetical protein
MKSNYFYIVLFACATVFFQCKKDKETEPDTTTTPVSAYTDVCIPKPGNNQYIPLAKDNKWTYSAQTMIGSLPVSSTIQKDTIAGGKTYYVATYTQNVLPKSHQRYNSGDSLVGLDPDTLAVGKLREQLLVPSNPTVSQAWTDPRGNTYTVESLTATLTIGSCTYTDLLKVHVVGSTATVDYYYKKGIGLVSIVCSSGCNFTSANLSSMSIY